MVQCATEETQNSQKTCHVDEVFDEFSIFGRYHLEVMALVIIAFASNAAYSANYVFAAERVGYRCKEPLVKVTQQQCAASSNATACAEWEYDDPNSFMAEFDLACQEWKRTLVGTAHSIGYMFGLLLIGPMSERLGRKAATVITGVLGAAFGLARSFTVWYWLYIALEFLESAIGDICSPIYVLEMEIASARNKIQFNFICGLGYVFGGVILALIAWLVPYWRTFLHVIYVPAFLFFFYLYLLDESPIWLLMRDKKEKTINILEDAAKTNKINLPDNKLDNNVSYEIKERVNVLNLLADTFKSSILRRRFFVCVLWWCTSTFVHYGMVINSVSLQGDKYVNFALTSMVGMPSKLLVMYILLYFRRKLPLMISFFLGGLMCFAQPFIPIDLPWLSITLYMIGKLISYVSFDITYVYTLELFPTYTRNSMHALCYSLGRIGAIVAPQTPLLMSIWSGLPTVLFGLSALIAGLSTLLMPDISNDVLQDTIMEAEASVKTKLPEGALKE